MLASILTTGRLVRFDPLQNPISIDVTCIVARSQVPGAVALGADIIADTTHTYLAIDRNLATFSTNPGGSSSPTSDTYLVGYPHLTCNVVAVADFDSPANPAASIRQLAVNGAASDAVWAVIPATTQLSATSNSLSIGVGFGDEFSAVYRMDKLGALDISLILKNPSALLYSSDSL